MQALGFVKISSIYCQDPHTVQTLHLVPFHVIFKMADTASLCPDYRSACESISTNVGETWLHTWRSLNIQCILRAILQESEAKLEMKNFNPPFNSCVKVGYLGG